MHSPTSLSLLLLFFSISSSFKNQKPTYKYTQTKCSTLSTSFFDDPYADLLNLSKPLDEALAEPVVGAATIITAPEDAKEIEIKPNTIAMKQSLTRATGLRIRDSDYWDKFIEENIDSTYHDTPEGWVLELRDLLEIQRGRAIWSKRTDKEIQKEYARSLMNKGPAIPSSVEMVITAVFLDRTHTISQIKKEEIIAFTEFKKWVQEQRKKSKKV